MRSSRDDELCADDDHLCFRDARRQANPCTFVAPCRSFQAGHDNTFPDGQITVLDPGTYGAVTITKSISIVNDGVGEASIPVSGGCHWDHR